MSKKMDENMNVNAQSEEELEADTKTVENKTEETEEKISFGEKKKLKKAEEQIERKQAYHKADNSSLPRRAISVAHGRNNQHKSKQYTISK